MQDFFYPRYVSGLIGARCGTSPQLPLYKDRGVHLNLSSIGGIRRSTMVDVLKSKISAEAKELARQYPSTPRPGEERHVV